MYFKIVFCVLVLMKCSLTQSAESLEPRIINGQLARNDNTKHQVSIRLKSQDSNFGNGHICGGALIGPSKVLTAAHCVYNSSKKKFRSAGEFSVVMGTLNRFQKPNGTIVSAVVKIATTGAFDINTMRDDVAIMFLKTGLPANKTHLTIEPIALTNRAIPTGSICQVSGWGKTSPGISNLPSELRIANVSIVDRNICALGYGNGLKSGMICAGDSVWGTDACQGDSGGPLVHNKSLVGIVSWGNGCGQSFFPGVYADVWYYRDWIIRTNSSGKLTWSGAIMAFSFIAMFNSIYKSLNLI